MADDLNVVPVRDEHEGAVVVRVVDLADARPSVVFPACLERGRVEGVYGFAILGRERHMYAAVRIAIALTVAESQRSATRVRLAVSVEFGAKGKGGSAGGGAAGVSLSVPLISTDSGQSSELGAFEWECVGDGAAATQPLRQRIVDR